MLASWWVTKLLKASLAKWLSVRLRSKWLWVRILLLLSLNPFHAPGLFLYQPTPRPLPPKKREKLGFSDVLMVKERDKRQEMD